MSTYIAYYRVSTKKQGQSGLGLEAQRTAVARFVGDNSIVAEFIEVESGKKSARPQLAAAIAECKRTGATLIVAKLDRLARNVAFTSALMEAGIDFVCCDMPYATRLTIHILAAIAEDEANRTSQRTKAALSELKARGVPLGSARPGHWEGREHRRGWRGMDPAKKAARLDEQFRATYAASLPLIETLHERGEGLTDIASTLNQRGLSTPRGASWTACAVHRVVKRLNAVVVGV